VALADWSAAKGTSGKLRIGREASLPTHEPINPKFNSSLYGRKLLSSFLPED
jgi:hypothetical protein